MAARACRMESEELAGSGSRRGRPTAAPLLLFCCSVAVCGWLDTGGDFGEALQGGRSELLGDGEVDEFLSQGLVSGVPSGASGTGMVGRTQSLSLEHLGSWKGLAKGLGVSMKDPLAHKPKFKDSNPFGPTSISAQADAKINDLVGSDPSISLSLTPKVVRHSQGLSAAPSVVTSPELPGLVLPSPGNGAADVSSITPEAAAPPAVDYAAERLQMRKYMLQKMASKSEVQTDMVASMPSPVSASTVPEALGGGLSNGPSASNMQLGIKAAAEARLAIKAQQPVEHGGRTSVASNAAKQQAAARLRMKAAALAAENKKGFKVQTLTSAAPNSSPFGGPAAGYQSQAAAAVSQLINKASGSSHSSGATQSKASTVVGEMMQAARAPQATAYSTGETLLPNAEGFAYNAGVADPLKSTRRGSNPQRGAARVQSMQGQAQENQYVAPTQQFAQPAQYATQEQYGASPLQYGAPQQQFRAQQNFNRPQQLQQPAMSSSMSSGGVQDHLFNLFTSNTNAKRYLDGAGSSARSGMDQLAAPASVAMASAGGGTDGDTGNSFDDKLFNIIHDCSVGGPGC